MLEEDSDAGDGVTRAIANRGFVVFVVVPSLCFSLPRICGAQFVSSVRGADCVSVHRGSAEAGADLHSFLAAAGNLALGEGSKLELKESRIPKGLSFWRGFRWSDVIAQPPRNQ